MAQVTIEDGNAGCTIGGVTVEPIPGHSLSEQEYTMLAAEHLKKAIQYDLLAAQLRTPGGPEVDSTLFRHCRTQPGDDWVKRVERLNAIIDGLSGRGEAVGGAIIGTVVV